MVFAINCLFTQTCLKGEGNGGIRRFSNYILNAKYLNALTLFSLKTSLFTLFYLQLDCSLSFSFYSYLCTFHCHSHASDITNMASYIHRVKNFSRLDRNSFVQAHTTILMKKRLEANAHSTSATVN